VQDKWIAAGMSLMLCAPLGALVISGALPPLSLDISGPSPATPNYVRVELPPVQIVTAGRATDLDSAVILREELASADTRPSAADPQIAVAAALAVRSQAPEPEQAARISPSARPDSLLDVSFDLSQPDRVDRSSLDVRKVVRVDGADAGQATVRVGAGSALYIASEDLRTLLSSASRVDLAERLASGAEQPFLGFDEVRDKGLNLRYDAASDRILISG
jgi:hypothetical protein